MADTLPPEVLDDLVDLLVSCPAFVGVDRGRLSPLAHQAQIAYVAAAEKPLTRALVVQRGALMVRDQQGRSVDMVAEGEFASPAADEKVEPVESALVAWLPERALDLAWSVPASELPARAISPHQSRIDLQTAAVRTVMREPARVASTDETACAVAARMTENRVSSIIVRDGDRMGIVTDRDLRSRLVAPCRPGDTPIGEVTTFPVRTVDADTPIFEALIDMLTHGVHHLPVIEDDRLVGVVSSNDLLELGSRNPLYLRAAIDRATDVDAIVAAHADLPESVGALLSSGTSPRDVARVIATVTDRIQRRLLVLAQAELGEAPTPYGWIAFGSQGRREQTLYSDQDHGLLLPDGIGSDPQALEYYERLGVWMVDALERCGYARCDGNVMASNERWRRSATGWASAFASWISRPTEAHLLESTIAFDLRTVSGELQVRELLQPTIAQAADNALFLARLARDAVRHRPPIGFLGRFSVHRSGEHEGTLDIKAGAMLPITDIARLLTLARGGPEISTDSRLAAAIADHQISEELGATIRSGYALAIGVRLRHHLDQYRRGVPQDNWVQPDALEPLTRSQLRETFKAIRTVQSNLEVRYRVGMLG